jgi:hypothetical protein
MLGSGLCFSGAESGSAIHWTDAYGMYLAAAGATPVYQLLGKQGVIMQDEKPKIDVAYISGDLGYRYHDGGHTDAPDWPAFIQFASKYFNSKAPLDVTPETEIAQVDKAAGRAITSTVKITNQSVYRLHAPLWFVAKDLKAGRILTDAKGKTPEGNPYIAIPGDLKPGESVTLKVIVT